MRIKLPTIRKEIIDGQLKTTKGEKEFILDMSLASQMRYEIKFPELAKNEDLYGYAQRIYSIDSQSIGVIISKMKLLYCYFDTDISFVEFLQMFDLSDKDYINELTKRITDIFTLVFDSSCEKN